MSGAARRPLVAGNWKLHKTIAESKSLVAALRAGGAGKGNAEVALAPVFTALFAVREAIAGTPMKLAAQNVHYENQGAFTGEVSAPLLADAGCTYVIVGHSERRQLFGDDDTRIRKRVAAVFAARLAPILCVGETLEEREAKKTETVVLGQLDRALDGLSASDLAGLVIAYEPVWAIGTGRTAKPDDAQEVHAAIRENLRGRSRDLAEATRVLYGGSVKPDNAKELLGKPDIDGALVGGASLDSESFLAIVRAAD
jgi:triosephosphate isomerase